MTELRNIEFLSKPGFNDLIYVKFLSSNTLVNFEDLDDNQINILFLGMLEHRSLLKKCCMDNDDRRDIVKRFIIKYWSAYDLVADIDEDGKFHFESYDEKELVFSLIKNLNDQLVGVENSIKTLYSRKTKLQFDIALLSGTNFS